MIDPKELRIGNLLQSNEVVVSILEIDKDLIGCRNPHVDYLYSPSALSPIPLTEEWLRARKLPISFDFGNNFSCYCRGNVVEIEQYGEGCEELPHIKYVHQWQNIHYLLIGQELTIRQ